MSLVAILGAGEIGGAVARALTMRARVDVVRLIDETPGVAAGKALDLRQAGPIGGCDTRIEGTTDSSAAAGASAIVLADPASGGEWAGEPAAAVLRRLASLGCFQQSILVCAGAVHDTVMQHALDELGLPRRHVVGSAPEALAATARALVAVEARVASSQVSLTVLGKPPGRAVIPWTEASAGGHSIGSLLNASQMQLLERRLAGLWPPGPGTLGSAAALFCEAAATGSRRLFSAFVSLDRDNGTRAPVCAWSVSIGRSGVERVTTPSLTGRDRVLIDGLLGGL
jgi:malate dehydrogenase